MKHMKKTVVFTMIFTLMVACTACGRSAEAVAGQIVPIEREEVTMNGEVIPPESSSVEVTESPMETPEATATSELDETPISFGRMRGGIYTNDYLGIGCTLDSTWEFYTAEELQLLPDTMQDLYEGTELGDISSDWNQIMDMQAECVNDMTSINVVYQKMDMSQRVAFAMLNEDEIADATLSESELLIDSYAQVGIEVQNMTKKTVNFLGEEHVAIYTTAKLQEVDYYILQISYYHLGQYAVTLTFASFVEDKTEQLLDIFYSTLEPAGEPTTKPAISTLGQIYNNSYINEYGGFACELDSTWQYKTTEELLGFHEYLTEESKGTELEKALSQENRFLNISAECVNDMTSFNVLYQKMSMQEVVTYASLTEEEIIDMVLSQSELLTDSTALLDIEIEEMSKKMVNFLGEEHAAIYSVAKFQNVDYYILQLANYHLGEYSITITLTSFIEDKTDQLLDMFYKYE